MPTAIELLGAMPMAEETVVSSNAYSVNRATGPSSFLSSFTPARYLVGSIPSYPDLPVGGGQVFPELGVGAEGRVTDVTSLRTMPPFTTLVTEAVKDWQFVPAEEEAEPEPGAPARRPQRVASKVLVAGLFGPTLGEFSKDVASESDQTPFPLTIHAPSFPLQAHYAGAVLPEALVDPGGTVTDVAVVRSTPPYDDVERVAASQWTFRPARVRGRSVETLAYFLFGFSPAVLNNSQLHDDCAESATTTGGCPAADTALAAYAPTRRL